MFGNKKLLLRILKLLESYRPAQPTAELEVCINEFPPTKLQLPKDIYTLKFDFPVELLIKVENCKPQEVGKYKLIISYKQIEIGVKDEVKEKTSPIFRSCCHSIIKS